MTQKDTGSDDSESPDTANSKNDSQSEDTGTPEISLEAILKKKSEMKTEAPKTVLENNLKIAEIVRNSFKISGAGSSETKSSDSQTTLTDNEKIDGKDNRPKKKKKKPSTNADGSLSN